MIISLIAAMDEAGLIGRDNDLPWRLPADLKHFKTVTMGKPVLMGRKTWESIGRPLPGRLNVVVTRDADWCGEGCAVAHSIDEALSLADADEVMIIGGATFYEQMLPSAGRLYITRIHERFEGDAWFPTIDMDQWKLTNREDHAPDDDNPHSYSFLSYDRVEP